MREFPINWLRPPVVVMVEHGVTPRWPSTQDYVHALSEAGISHVTISKKGYHLNPEVGTWGHPKMAEILDLL